jgi:hypothetical protein
MYRHSIIVSNHGNIPILKSEDIHASELEMFSSFDFWSYLEMKHSIISQFDFVERFWNV